MNKKRNVEPLIPIGMIGCFSEVDLTRKLFQLAYNIGWAFDVRKVTDIYPEQDVKRGSTLLKIFEDIETKRLRKEIDPLVKYPFISGILSGRIEYFQTDGCKVPPEFFEGIEAVDISSPNLFHYSQFQRVLEAQKDLSRRINILMEKPVVVSLEEVNRMDLFLNSGSHNLDGLILMDSEHYSHYGPTRHLRRSFQWFLEEMDLGKVTGIKGYILEDDDFSKERNKSIIDINVSGGGIWLDTGIHLVAFLRYLGAELDHDRAIARKFKSSYPEIQGSHYMETAMYVSVPIKEKDYFVKDCIAELYVAKEYPKNKKGFLFECENGSIEVDIVNKKTSLKRDNHNGECIALIEGSFPLDAFFYVLGSFHSSIKSEKEPETPYENGLRDVRDNRLIYSKAGEIESFDKAQIREVLNV